MKAAPARLAGPRGPARARRLGAVADGGAAAGRRRRDGASCCARVQARDREALTPHQRAVLVALTLDGVPIDVLAERLGTTRGALYKTLHDARRKLRAQLRCRARIAGAERRLADERPTTTERASAALLGPAGPGGHLRASASSSSTATSSSSSPAPTPRPRCPGMRAHLEGCPACAEDHAALRALLRTGV